MRSRALVAREFGAPAKIETIEVPEPGPGEVRIRIVASGVCGSDGHVLHGASTAVRLPTVLGHEGAGVVESAGPGVDNVSPGDHVVIGLGIWCGDCDYCTSGRPWLCDSPKRMASFIGLRPDGSTRVTSGGEPLHTMLGVGTLSEFALAPARQVVAVDPALPLDELCLIGCGVTTGVGAALHTAQVSPAHAVAVIGCGGVGLSVVQGARIAGAHTIIAIDQVPRKLDLARELGATHVLNPADGDVREAVLAITGRGVDYAFEVVGKPDLVTLALTLVRAGGTAVVVGISPPGSQITLEREWLMGERRLMTSAGGSVVPALGIPKLVEMVTSGRLRLSDMIDRRLPLDRVDEAFAALDSGEVARSVIVFDEQAQAPEIADVLRHLDIYNADMSARLDETLEHARTHCPVAHSDANGGYHLVSRYADVRTVLSDDAQFSSKGGKSLPPRQLLDMPPLDSDPPEHRGYRRLLNPFFSRRGLEKHEPAIREIARGLIDQFIGSGRFEVVEDFASPLTAATLCKVILNLDDDELMTTARERVVAIGEGNAAQAWVDLTEFLTTLIRERRPGGDGNVLDAVLSGAIDGTPLTDEQKLGIIIVLFLGGLDTTRAQITCIAHHLAAHPELEQRLRQPDWARTDLDEFLRHDSVVTAMARKVTGPTELNGVALGAEDRILVHYYSANHDAEQFERPGEFFFDRDRNPHVAFGIGIHRCLGSNLARLQIQVAFDELLARVTNLRIAPGAQIAFSPGVTRMPEALPLEFDR